LTPYRSTSRSLASRLVTTTRTPVTQPSLVRPFSSTPSALKKGGKAAREATRAAEPSASSPETDFSDLSTLEAEISKAIEKLKTDLSKLRTGGRFNPEAIETLRVQPEKNSKTTYPLSDLAQVVPKGRTMQILVSEESYVKPVSSAIQGSKLSLTPTPDPTGQSATLLVVQVPPPTAESRRQVVAEAIKAGDKAGDGVRAARGAQQKRLRKFELDRAARPDDLRKAGKMMEGVVEKAMTEVKRIVEGAKKVLDQ